MEEPQTLASQSVASILKSTEKLTTEPTKAQSAEHLSRAPSKPETIQRRIIAEDPEWNLAPVPRLTDLCVKVIVANFEKSPSLKGLPEKYRDIVIGSIPTSLALSIAAPLIPDAAYWKRRSREQFQLASVTDHGNDWKRLYFELYLQSEIEKFIPSSDVGVMEEQLKSLKQSLTLGAAHVESLNLRQLRPLNVIPQPDDLERAMADTKTAGTPATRTLDHLDVGMIISMLGNLKKLKDCGIDFSWQYFGMTMKDAIGLCNGLKTFQLEQIQIQASSIDDDKARLIFSALLQNTKLTQLDLSHNKIGNHGARGLAKLLAQPHCALKTVKICNNLISNDGAKVLGKALQQNKSLEHLDLRLNHLHDEGGYSLMVLLLQNKTLISLDLSGNGLESKSVTALCALLKQNSPALQRLDLSCNKLGNQTEKTLSVSNLKDVPQGKPSDITGKQIFEAVTQNKYITSIDLRTTGISPEYIVAIQGITTENTSM